MRKLISIADAAALTAIDAAELGAISWSVLMRHDDVAGMIRNRLEEVREAAKGDESIVYHTDRHLNSVKGGIKGICLDLISKIENKTDGDPNLICYILTALAEAAKPNPRELMLGEAYRSCARTRRALASEVPLIHELMEQFPDFPALQQAASSLLSSLSTREACEKLRGLGAIETLKSVLEVVPNPNPNPNLNPNPMD